MIKKIIPSTLIGRSIIIIFVPIIIIVLLTSFVFYQTSWSIISKRLTESVAADINVLVKLINSDLTDNAINIANQDFKMKINIINDKRLLASKFSLNSGILSNRLNQSLSNLKKKFDYDLSNLEEGVLIYIQIDNDILEILSKRMIISDKIGKLKKKQNVAVLQSKRWNEILGKMILEGKEKEPRDHFFYYYGNNNLEAVRKDNWKLILPHSSRSYKGVLLHPKSI